MNKLLATSILGGLAMLCVPLAAKATGSVIVNGYYFQCQNSCQVGVSDSGQMYVVDSQYGWVRMVSLGKGIPVPQFQAEDAEGRRFILVP